jgi:hypothetical protein
MQQPASPSFAACCCLLGLPYDLADDGCICFRNVVEFLSGDTASWLKKVTVSNMQTPPVTGFDTGNKTKAQNTRSRFSFIRKLKIYQKGKQIVYIFGRMWKLETLYWRLDNLCKQRTLHPFAAASLHPSLCLRSKHYTEKIWTAGLPGYSVYLLQEHLLALGYVAGLTTPATPLLAHCPTNPGKTLHFVKCKGDYGEIISGTTSFNLVDGYSWLNVES